MKRPIDPEELISLPRLSAYEAISLAQALHAATRDENDQPRALPAPVSEALTDMDSDRAALQQAAGAPEPPKALRAADLLEDNAVGAFVDVLRGWARLAGKIPEGDIASRLIDRLFKEGTAFLNYRPAKEWAIVEGKLQIIAAENLAADIAKLGAAPMLQHLQDVHKVYGEATGVTKVVAEPESPEIRGKLDALLASIRHYAAAVMGSVVRRKPETKALADILLQPLTAWESPAPKPKAPAPTDEGGKPADK